MTSSYIGNIKSIVIIVTLSCLFRIFIACFGYSGYQTPPKFGDFEAQRHWLEITTNLHISDWYRQTERNDLQYWGLDYPPLTAYHSWIMGQFAWIVYPDIVTLHTSRGHETLLGKVFMRSTVIISDLMLYIPASLLLLRLVRQQYTHCNNANKTAMSANYKSILYTFICINTPGLLLIDHGHFQYNSISIGLTLLSVYTLILGYDIYGSILFTLALNYKQMTLYYSPVFFVYLLRKCWIQNTNTVRIMTFIKIGFSVIFTFIILWLPFCIYKHRPEETYISIIYTILLRMFPFARGIFEDKVANIWYALSVVYDYRQIRTISSILPTYSLLLTIVLIVPVCSMLSYYPCRNRLVLLLALSNCSLAFFLASFQA